VHTQETRFQSESHDQHMRDGKEKRGMGSEYISNVSPAITTERERKERKRHLRRKRPHGFRSEEFEAEACKPENGKRGGKKKKEGKRKERGECGLARIPPLPSGLHRTRERKKKKKKRKREGGKNRETSRLEGVDPLTPPKPFGEKGGKKEKGKREEKGVNSGSHASES